MTRSYYDLADLELVLVELFQLPRQRMVSLYLHLTHHAIKMPGGKTPLILDVDNQWTTAASFTLWPLYRGGGGNSVAYWN
jgi:hypothetical protein